MTKEEIKSKMQVGDISTLAKILKINPDAARKRFDRDKKDALEAMEKIITTREELIQGQEN